MVAVVLFLFLGHFRTAFISLTAIPLSLLTAVVLLDKFGVTLNTITLGGPSDSTLTLSLYIYNLTFKFMPSLGYASTVSYVIVVLVGVLSFLQFMVARDRRG